MPDLQGVQADLLALTAATRRSLTDVWQQLHDAERRLVDRWPSLTPTQRRAELRALQHLAEDLMSQAAELVQATAPDVIRVAYQAGAAGTAADLRLPQIGAHRDVGARQVFEQDTYRDLLTATEHVTQTTKELVRYLAKEHAADRLTGNLTAERAGRRLAEDLAGRGIAAVVYRDGSRHGLADYADMVLRTKTAEAFQVGGFNQARAHGVQFMELLDGPSCGLDGHDDPTKANGLVLPIETAERYPISHPRCVRTSTPRIDIGSADEARRARGSATAAQNADQAGVEAARAAMNGRLARTGTIERRLQARATHGALAPAPAMASTAGRQHTTIAARRAARIARRDAQA